MPLLLMLTDAVFVFFACLSDALDPIVGRATDKCMCPWGDCYKVRLTATVLFAQRINETNAEPAPRKIPPFYRAKDG